MKKIILFTLLMIIAVTFVACNSHICLEVGCKNERIDSDYCEEHLKVYEFERRFYDDVSHVVDALSEEYAYSVSTKYELKEVVVNYTKHTESEKEKNQDLPEYMEEIYVYYTINGFDRFAKYDEWYKLYGVTPKVNSIDEERYTHARKATMGGVASFDKKVRNGHYSWDSPDAWEKNVYFMINFDDYTKQGY